MKTLSEKIEALKKSYNFVWSSGELKSWENLFSEITELHKEFIRLLKEGIHAFNEMEIGDKGRNEFIDKLAGEKLTETEGSRP